MPNKYWLFCELNDTLEAFIQKVFVLGCGGDRIVLYSDCVAITCVKTPRTIYLKRVHFIAFVLKFKTFKNSNDIILFLT